MNQNSNKLSLINNSRKLSMKVIFLVFVFVFFQHVDSFNTRRYTHNIWMEQDRKLSKITDTTWNYCDVKCTYLEVHYPQYDFVVMYFKKIQTQQIIGSCYIKGDVRYYPWKSLVSNSFYEKACGFDDQKNFYERRDKYELLTIKAIGKGVQLPENYYVS